MAHAKTEPFDYSEEVTSLKSELAALRADMGKLVNSVMDLTKHSAGDVKDKARAEVDAKLGQLHEAYDAVCDNGGKACAKVTDTVEEHPMASVLVALGAGLLIGHVLRRDVGLNAMKAITDLIISLVEYLKAELDEARFSLYGLLVGFFLLFAAMIFGIAALALVLGSLYAGLRHGMGPASSALLTAVFSLIITGGLAWLAWLKFQR